MAPFRSFQEGSESEAWIFDVMSFGTELWDKVKLVGSYSEHAIWYMDKTNDFLKDIVAAEQEYAKSVIRASKAVKEEFQRRQNDKSDFMKSMYNLYHSLIEAKLPSAYFLFG
jgi:hypothetical protein